MDNLSFNCPFCSEAVALPDNYCQQCGLRLFAVQIRHTNTSPTSTAGATISTAVADNTDAPYTVSPGLSNGAPRPVRWMTAETAPDWGRRTADNSTSPAPTPARRNVASLLYDVKPSSQYAPYDDPNDITVDFNEVTISMSRAEMYASGSYRRPDFARSPLGDGRILVDMCLGFSAVALIVVAASWTTDVMMHPQHDKISKAFNSAEIALNSKQPEHAAEILDAIPAGTPGVISPKRAGIFNRAMIARAITKTAAGKYPEAMADLRRISAKAAEAPRARQLFEECKNLEAFSNDVRIRIGTKHGITALAPVLPTPAMEVRSNAAAEEPAAEATAPDASKVNTPSIGFIKMDETSTRVAQNPHRRDAHLYELASVPRLAPMQASSFRIEGTSPSSISGGRPNRAIAKLNRATTAKSEQPTAKTEVEAPADTESAAATTPAPAKEPAAEDGSTESFWSLPESADTPR